MPNSQLKQTCTKSRGQMSSHRPGFFSLWAHKLTPKEQHPTGQGMGKSKSMDFASNPEARCHEYKARRNECYIFAALPAEISILSPCSTCTTTTAQNVLASQFSPLQRMALSGLSAFPVKTL